jgi:SAM-dependent methyltransferase
VTTATDRLRDEQAFHDRQAHERAAHFCRQPDDLLLNDTVYLDHAPWIRPALAQLGDVRDRRILDFGCGHGMAAVVLSRRGARVTAFDLSLGYLKEAQTRSRANSTTIDFLAANGERLPFADASFDGIWGNAVLHHLDLRITAPELNRVLRPGGVAIFCEPWGGNPLLGWARRYVPYPGKQRTADEEPLRRRDLQTLRTVFPGLEMRGFQLLAMVRRLLPSRGFMAGLERWDERLLSRCPGLQQFCRYVVLTLRRPDYNEVDCLHETQAPIDAHRWSRHP